MNCPHCQAKAGKVLSTAHKAGQITRRRACTQCGARWTTKETVVQKKKITFGNTPSSRATTFDPVTERIALGILTNK